VVVVGMPEWLKDLGTLLTLGASLISVGVALGSLPRLSKSLDDHKKADRSEKDLLWLDTRLNERELAKFKEHVAERFGAIE
jgi:hypothetical protein